MKKLYCTACRGKTALLIHAGEHFISKKVMKGEGEEDWYGRFCKVTSEMAGIETREERIKRLKSNYYWKKKKGW